jgi:hypothetical protein
MYRYDPRTNRLYQIAGADAAAPSGMGPLASTSSASKLIPWAIGIAVVGAIGWYLISEHEASLGR